LRRLFADGGARLPRFSLAAWRQTHLLHCSYFILLAPRAAQIQKCGGRSSTACWNVVRVLLTTRVLVITGAWLLCNRDVHIRLRETNAPTSKVDSRPKMFLRVSINDMIERHFGISNWLATTTHITCMKRRVSEMYASRGPGKKLERKRIEIQFSIRL